MLRTFWNDEDGFLISAELVIIATLLVLGLIVGFVQVQVALLGELGDIACAIGSFNQSFSVPTTQVVKGTHIITVGGSSFRDETDQCDCAGQCNTFLCSAIIGELPHFIGVEGPG